MRMQVSAHVHSHYAVYRYTAWDNTQRKVGNEPHVEIFYEIITEKMGKKHSRIN